MRLVAAHNLLRDFSESPLTSVSLEAERTPLDQRSLGDRQNANACLHSVTTGIGSTEFQGKIRNQPSVKERNRYGLGRGRANLWARNESEFIRRALSSREKNGEAGRPSYVFAEKALV